VLRETCGDCRELAVIRFRQNSSTANGLCRGSHDAAQINVISSDQLAVIEPRRFH